MNRALAAPFAATIAIAAGCGGSHAATAAKSHAHAGTTTTVTTTDTASKEPADDQSGTTAAPAIGSRQVHAYFQRVSAVRRQLVITRRSTHALTIAIAASNGYAAASAARRAAAGVHQALVIAKRITPREPLRTIHTELLANLRLGVVYLTQMANDLESQDMQRIRRWRKTVMPNLHRSERWYAEWAANSAAVASLFGVRAPHWLHTMDRWN
jgi:hypothetical protein